MNKLYGSWVNYKQKTARKRKKKNLYQDTSEEGPNKLL